MEKQLGYTLKDFIPDYNKVLKITWNDKILYDDTTSYYDPCLASVATLNAVKVEYGNRLIHKLDIGVANNTELILNVIGE